MSDRAAAPADFVFDEHTPLPPGLRGGVVAIGNFDGVHRGHQHLLSHGIALARERGLPVVAVTFEPHPRTVFRPETPVFRLTPPQAKARVLAALGYEGMVVIPFSREFSRRSAEEFVADILVGGFGLEAAIVGYDFHFGRDRGGSPDFLRRAGSEAGFDVTVVGAALDASGEAFSSVRIRDALERGDVDKANGLLGYRWFVSGPVVHGDARGRELGYPTANLRLPPDCRLRHGIYAVRFRRPDGTVHDGVASYGRRPTFDDGPPLLETHLFDFAGDLYDETATVSLVGWIRPEERFETVEALIARMDADSALARAILASTGEGTALDRALDG